MVLVPLSHKLKYKYNIELKTGFFLKLILLEKTNTQLIEMIL